jgi:hypothetical protein
MPYGQASSEMHTPAVIGNEAGSNPKIADNNRIASSFLFVMTTGCGF